MERVLCASPAFVAKHSKLNSIEALGRVPCVVQGNTTRWVFESGENQEANVIDVRGRFGTNSILALREAILGGAGVGRLPLWLADDDLKKKRLVRVLPQLSLPPADVYGMFHEGSRGSAAIHAALEFLEVAKRAQK